MSIVKQEMRFLFLRNRSGFILPIQAKIRLDIYRDLGASALVNLIHNGCHYILINKSGLIEEMSEEIFSKIFQKNMNLDIS
jgi:hypothetical protein